MATYDIPAVTKSNYLGSRTPGIPSTGGIGVKHTLYMPLAAGGAAGAGDDVTLISSLPFKAVITEVTLYVTTAVAASTLTVRTAAAGAGTALTSALSVAAAVPVRTAITTGAPTVASGTALYANRSDRSMVGMIAIELVEIQ